MSDIMDFDLEPDKSSIIKVIGVGGGGSNAVNHMFRRGIKDVNFVVCNTDGQALNNSPVAVKLQLGATLTLGRGAGSKPEIGKKAAEESLPEINEILENNTSMVFITAGMGGGTGTGAAPIIAKEAKSKGILTVGIVTIPFTFEGPERINQAIKGISELKDHVDSLLVINNEKLREAYGNLALSEAFSRADDVLATAAKGIAEIITVHGYVNVDFADVQTVMTNSGVSIMGSGYAKGENRASKAIEMALNSPLLNNNDIKGAKSVLLNITSGAQEITMDEISEITDYVVNSSSRETTLIWGMGHDEALEDSVSVTIIATGFKMNSIHELYEGKKQIDKVTLNDGRTFSNVRDGEESVTQQSIEFEVKESSDGDIFSFKTTASGIEQVHDDKKASRVQSLKETHERLKEGGYIAESRDSEIEEMENIPAYVRKKMNLNPEKTSGSEEISRFRLSDDDENGPKLRSDNSYLHDNVD